MVRKRHTLDKKGKRLTEGGFDNGDLGSGRVETCERAPVVDDETGTDDLGTTVHGTGLEWLSASSAAQASIGTYNKRHLEQARQLILL